MNNTLLPLPLGVCVATPTALEVLGNEVILNLLKLHQSHYWGYLSPEDMRANETALVNNGRILSFYKYYGESVYVITEADRSTTTVLMVYEY